jgi:hypothetical protein
MGDSHSRSARKAGETARDSNAKQEMKFQSSCCSIMSFEARNSNSKQETKATNETARDSNESKK